MSTSQHRRLSHQINVGLTQAEAEHVDAAARAAGVSRAAFARRHVLAALGQVDATAARRGGTSLPPKDVTAVATLAGSVGRCAGATVQLAKALREAGHGSFHALAERVLADLRRQSADLAVIIERMK
ncbi:hypothetical protein [Pelagibacterium lacus]|uniref:Uncharacterized protein n=1 Tax=Pelagibacterium lacus TaxID=2282655 RepID=A0A369W7C7_9HYPH|nr:hypothetical protein [Pelagibacterium lacus]RDE09889.1 hypothetical protein DVH29_04985 [Pelagibacterium lacus]